MKVGLAFSTKNRIELTQQSIAPLLQPDKFDLWWIDGSTESAAENLPLQYPAYIHVHANVRGGADSAIVYGLTTLLQAAQNYDVVGLCENDVLLHEDFFGPMMSLFERGRADGLEVGAVTPRVYDDRVLIQRDGYCVLHNAGAGVVFFTRRAAELVLTHFRTTFWRENRTTFEQLSGVDVGKYAAFRVNEQWCCADWGFDKVLAQFGLCTLGLTPSPVEMIGQIPPLHEQGLRIANKPVELLRDDKAFAKFAENTKKIREKRLRVADRGGVPFHQSEDGSWTVFPHQVAALDGKYDGDWRLKWSQGFGPFAYKTPDAMAEMWLPTLHIRLSGACSFLVSGGKEGGRVKVEDKHSGYTAEPLLPPEGDNGQILNLQVPGGVVSREIVLTMLSPGTCFYGIMTREAQMWNPQFTFDHSMLPLP